MNKANGEKEKGGAVVKPNEETNEVILPRYSEEDKAIIDRYLGRKKSLPPRLKGRLKDGVCQVDFDSPEDILLLYATMVDAPGVVYPDLWCRFLSQVGGTYFKNNKDPIIANLNNSIALLHGIRPQDEVEAMLAVQMAGAHNLSMEFLKWTMLEEQPQDGVTDPLHR